MKAIVCRELGGPEVMRLEEVPTPTPKRGQVLLKVHSVSVNRTLDLDIRAGTVAAYYETVLPLILGLDPAGEIAAVGEGVTGFKVGDRVSNTSQYHPCFACPDCVAERWDACTTPKNLGRHIWGGYAEYVILATTNVVPIPENVSFAEATLVTRHAPMALRQIRRVSLERGEWVLVMAAAGGLGTMLVQTAKQMGCTVIGAAGADERVKLACELGADFGINYRTQDLEEEVRRITEGRGVNVVFENIGDPQLWPKVINSLARYGRLTTVGAHGGNVVPLDVRRMYQRNLSLLGGGTEGSYQDYVDCLEMASKGQLKAVIDRILPLSQAVASHELVAQNEPVGKVILDPTLD